MIGKGTRRDGGAEQNRAQGGLQVGATASSGALRGEQATARR